MSRITCIASLQVLDDRLAEALRGRGLDIDKLPRKTREWLVTDLASGDSSCFAAAVDIAVETLEGK